MPLDWVGLSLSARRYRPYPECAGDSVFSTDLPTLPWGSVWRGQNLTCESRESGLACWNSWGHGFTLGDGWVARF